MKSSFNKYKNYIVYGGFILIFMLLVFLATFNQVERAVEGGGWNSTTTVYGLPIAWYAVFIMTGLMFGAVLLYFEFKRSNVDTEILWDGLMIFVIVGVLGARLWYVFSDILKSIGEGTLANNNFIKNPLEIIGLTSNGFQLAGLAIHGGIIFVFLGLILFARKKRISYWWLMDTVAPGFLIGQAMGRWGNFINRELKGPVIENLNWLPSFIRDRMDFRNGVNGVNLTNTPEYHHPVFLYESTWNLIGLIIVLALRHKKKFKLGDIFAFYLVWYGVGRIPNEILRIIESSLTGEPLAVGGLSISIMTSIGLIIAGLLVFFLKRKFVKDLPLYDDYGKKGVFFDLDGTLLDTYELIVMNTKETFKKFLPDVKLTDAEYKTFFGPPLETSFGWYEKDPVKVKEMVEFYRQRNKINHDKGVKPFPHAKETLEQLKAHGYAIAVVSSKMRFFVELGLKQSDLLQYVDYIVGSDEVKHHKPHAEPINKALKALSISKENCAYVGDHSNDIIAAKNAGMVSIGVSYSINYKEVLEAKPDYVIDDLEKLLEIF